MQNLPLEIKIEKTKQRIREWFEYWNGDILIDEEGKYYNTGERQTGCMFCAFGVHMEKGLNKFQRMKVSHPKLWDYCINKLGLGMVLDYIKVPYN